MFTCSAEKIFIPMRYTRYYYRHSSIHHENAFILLPKLRDWSLGFHISILFYRKFKLSSYFMHTYAWRLSFLWLPNFHVRTCLTQTINQWFAFAPNILAIFRIIISSCSYFFSTVYRIRLFTKKYTFCSVYYVCISLNIITYAFISVYLRLYFSSIYSGDKAPANVAEA